MLLRSLVGYKDVSGAECMKTLKAGTLQLDEEQQYLYAKLRNVFDTNGYFLISHIFVAVLHHIAVLLLS